MYNNSSATPAHKGFRKTPHWRTMKTRRARQSKGTSVHYQVRYQVRYQGAHLTRLTETLVTYTSVTNGVL